MGGLKVARHYSAAAQIFLDWRSDRLTEAFVRQNLIGAAFVRLRAAIRSTFVARRAGINQAGSYTATTAPPL
jgi:hypothetical protein